MDTITGAGYPSSRFNANEGGSSLLPVLDVPSTVIAPLLSVTRVFSGLHHHGAGLRLSAAGVYRSASVPVR